MGGKKKPTISSLERKMRKMREREREERRKERGERKTSVKKRTNINDIMEEIKSLRYITPFIMYQKYGIKISDAKRILRKLHEEGFLTLYSSGRRVPIYIPKSS